MRKTIIQLAALMLVSAFGFIYAHAQINNYSADVAEEYNLTPPPSGIVVPLSKIANYGDGRTDVLYNNGPLITNTGIGFNGYDISVLQTNLGLNTFGFGAQLTVGSRIADDFVVNQTWTVESIKLFSYQSFSGTTSTFTGGYIRILDNAPNAGGNVIWGDLTTNRMVSSSFSGIYRVNATSPQNSDRPVMEIVCTTPGLVLNPGAYWIEFFLDGTLSSGPWLPPISILGQTITGNALQFDYVNGVWAVMYDIGLTPPAPQGAPFVIYGTTGVAPIPLSNWALYLGIMLIVIFTFIRFRRMI